MTRKIGPGALVTAAFIGPGTVTACTLAGANFGYALAWALVIATLATIILQEMAARLGVVTRKGLGENLADLFADGAFKWPLAVLVGLALYLGNAAYEAGNLTGAALGISGILGESRPVFVASVVGMAMLAAILLLAGTYRQIERVLMVLVAVMASAFVATFVIVQPDLGALGAAIVTPAIPAGGLLTVAALVGTTVVPYNLFLHASAARNAFSGAQDLPAARHDAAVTIGLGGLVAILILSTASASLFARGIAVEGASDMAEQLAPLFGPFARYLLGIGLFAAGLTSAITAPLATGYAMSEILRLEGGQQGRGFRIIALSVILVGSILALAGIRPIEVIVIAQIANGLLLPIIAAFLLYAVNRAKLLGEHANGTLANLLGIAVVLLAAGLGLRIIYAAIAPG